MKPCAGIGLRAALLTLLLVGLPLLGLVVAGRPVAPYLAFPPRTRFVTHAPFSWTAFALIGLLVLISLWPIATLVDGPPRPSPKVKTRYPFPWWGWGGGHFWRHQLGAGLEPL